MTEEEIDNNSNYYSKKLSLDLSRKKDSLWFRYLMGYLTAKNSVWSKSPYMFILFLEYQKFNISEIGTLYAIDHITALIVGPIIGSLADRYGRKKFAMLYSVLNIINLSFRLSKVKTLAYMAQVCTGMGSGIIATIFESWVIFEANKEFGLNHEKEKDRYIKKLFKAQNLIDASSSIVVSAICAMSYYIFGIFGPVGISMIFSLISIITIMLSWSENKPASFNISNTFNQYKEAFMELKKREVLTMGIIESTWAAVLSIFIFAWTPILKSSTQFEFNPGMVFFCFVMAIISGTKLYEIFVIHLRSNVFICMFFVLLVEILAFLILYSFNIFYVRFLMCIIINGICGIYQPINSIIKAKILKEKYRALLMNLFRVPLNLYVVFVLIFIKKLEASELCIVCSLLLIVSLLGALSLFLYPFEKQETSTTKNFSQEDLIELKDLRARSSFNEEVGIGFNQRIRKLSIVE